MENLFESILCLQKTGQAAALVITTMKEKLQRQGIPKEAFARLQAPIGLDIGAETPEEIAISIAAEIVATKKGKLHLFKKGEG